MKININDIQDKGYLDLDIKDSLNLVSEINKLRKEKNEGNEKYFRLLQMPKSFLQYFLQNKNRHKKTPFSMKKTAYPVEAGGFEPRDDPESDFGNPPARHRRLVDRPLVHSIAIASM